MTVRINPGVEHIIEDAQDPVNPTDVSNRRYVDAAIANIPPPDGTGVETINGVQPDTNSNISLVQGDNITITPDADTKTIRISSSGGPSTDVRPLLEQAKARMLIGNQVNTITRDSGNLTMSETINVSDGTTATHMIERLADGRPRVLTREYWQGAYIANLIASNTGITGDALVHTVMRPASGIPLAVSEEWAFGFASGAIASFFITNNGTIAEFNDAENEIVFTDNGTIADFNNRLFVTDNGTIVEFT